MHLAQDFMFRVRGADLEYRAEYTDVSLLMLLGKRNFLTKINLGYLAT